MKPGKTVLFFSFVTILIIVIPCSSAAQISFLKPDFSARRGPSVLDDFNRDGISDIAVAIDGQVIVHVSPGDGTIGPEQAFSGGPRPLVIISGDFNNDGLVDLAELGADGSITVLLGNGDGTFSQPITTQTGFKTTQASLAANDFNNDGTEDLAICDFDGTIGILIGNGDGTFSVSNFGVGVHLRAIEAADFDGDGNVDLAVLTCCTDNNNTGDLQTLRGAGDGTFASLTEVAQISGPVGLTARDLNNDGHPDLLVTFSNRGMDIFINRGDGTFNATLGIGTNFQAPSLPAIGDFNGDGIPDLAFEEEDSIRVFLGNGDGTFGAPQFYAKGPRLFAATPTLVGDFNGDGILDLVTVNANDTVTLLTGNGDGTFNMRMRFPTGASPTGVAVSDFNGDGIPDIVATNTQGNSISILLGNGDGTFQPRSDFQAGGKPALLAVADFNGDGAPDVAVLDSGFFSPALSIMLNNGDGTFTESSGPAIDGRAQDIVAGDFNGDGIPDLAVSNGTGGTVSIFLGNGDGTFSAKIDSPAGPSASALAVGDFNGDGIPDLAIANRNNNSSSVTILLGNGDGTFRQSSVMATLDFPTAVTVGDFNGDGIPDVAWTISNAEATPSVVVAIGNGDGTFGAPNRMIVGGTVLTRITTADINGDGLLDIVAIGVGFTGGDSTDVVILPGNGDGTFQAQKAIPAGAGLASGVVADLDGDGKPDVAVGEGDIFGPTISILLNRSH